MTDEQFQVLKRLEAVLMATQADVDALTATITEVAQGLEAVTSDLAATTTAVQDEISKLESGLDLSALTAAVEPLSASVASIDEAVKALAPAPAAAAPATEAPSTTEATPATEAAPDTAVAATDSSELPKPVYTTTLPPAAVDVTAWTAAGYETANDPSGSPQTLYFYIPDTDGGTATGNGLDNGAWNVYQGPIEQVPAA